MRGEVEVRGRGREGVGGKTGWTVVLVEWVVGSCVLDLGWVFRSRWAMLDYPFLLYFAGVRERT